MEFLLVFDYNLEDTDFADSAGTLMYDGINKLFISVSKSISNRISVLADRYENTLRDIDSDISSISDTLSKLVDELVGDEFDMNDYKKFKQIFRKWTNINSDLKYLNGWAFLQRSETQCCTVL